MSRNSPESTARRIRRFVFVRGGLARHGRPVALAWIGTLWVIAQVVFAPEVASGQDRVTVRDEETGETRERAGTILEYNKRFLELETTSSRSTRIPASQVVNVQTDFVESHATALRQLAAADYRGALASLDEAMRIETREWVLREQLAQRVSICRMLNIDQEACEDFLLLNRSESNHRHWNVAPLPWRSEVSAGGVEDAAEEWMASEDAAERLFGASWLLQGNRRPDAERVLRELSRSQANEIGYLAVAQLWRLVIVQPNTDLDAWITKIDEMPVGIRGGPRYLLARAYQQQDQASMAATTYMKVRIVHPQNLDLGAIALFETSRILREMNRTEESRRVIMELKTTFPDSIFAQQTETLLDSDQ